MASGIVAGLWGSSPLAYLFLAGARGTLTSADVPVADLPTWQVLDDVESCHVLNAKSPMWGGGKDPFLFRESMCS